MAVNLTQGAIARICSRNVSDYKALKPVLQVIDCESEKLLLSDGSHYTRAILARNLKETFISRILHKGCFVKLIHFVVEQEQNFMVVTILDLDVIPDNCDRIVGEPIALLKEVPSRPNVADLFSDWRKERTAVKLTQGAISIMCHDKFYPDDVFKPVLQVIDVEQLPYRRIVLSDGWNYNVGRFLKNLDELDYSSRLQKGSIVKLTDFVITKSRKNEKNKTIIIDDLDVLVDKYEVVGDPDSLDNKLPYSRFAANVVHSNSCDLNQFFRVLSPTGRKARVDVNLTQGAIVTICNANICCDKEFKPVLQVIDNQNDVLWLSDGSHYHMGFVSLKLEQLQKGSVVKLRNFIVIEHENRKVILIIGFDVILEECELIGEPVPLPINPHLQANMAGLSIS